jgi:hypothetical protein
MYDRYRRFVESLPELAAGVDANPDELPFSDLSFLAACWLAVNRAPATE